MTLKLTARQVLARMKRGDLPYTVGDGIAAKFDDGARASARIMRRLRKEEKIAHPKRPSVHSPWTLV